VRRRRRVSVLAVGASRRARLRPIPRSARQRGTVVDLAPDRDARLAAVARLLPLLAAMRGRFSASERASPTSLSASRAGARKRAISGRTTLRAARRGRPFGARPASAEAI
jgi:hypothetical protein